MSRRSESARSETDAGKAEGFDPEAIPASVERTPTVLLLDTSSSMANASPTSDGDRNPRIEQLNEGLRLFKQEVSSVTHAQERVDVAVVTFSSTATVEQEFTAVTNWEPPTLEAQGGTAMGTAVERAIELITERKQEYRERGVPYNRPLIWLLTDGEPTDMAEGGPTWTRVQNRLDADRAFEFFAMGVSEDADIPTLNALVAPTGRPALRIKQGMFTEYFEFLSNSLTAAADPGAGGEVTFDREQLAQITESDFVQYSAETDEAAEADNPVETDDAESER